MGGDCLRGAAAECTMTKAKTAAVVYVVGSVVTLAIVWWLWRHHRPVVAMEVVVASPFPCPTGLPC